MIIEQFIEALKSCLNETQFFVFALFTVFDIVTGFSKSFITKTPSSSKGARGLLKHALKIIACLLFVTVFTMLNQPEYGKILLSFMYAVEGISIIGNLNDCGLVFPEWIINHFSDTKDKLPERKDEEK